MAHASQPQELFHRYFDLSGSAAASRPNASRWLLVISLCLCLSILYQVYFYDFQNGELNGGERPRLLLKIGSSLLLCWSLRHYFSPDALALNLVLKIPLLFVALSILAVMPYLTPDYLQAVNLFFFLPVFLVDWNRPGGLSVYKAIWAAIAVIVVVQLALDPLCKAYFQVGWANAAVIGGMGNPNVFGLFLIVAGLAVAILLQPRVQFVSTLLFLATALTGSLVSSIVGFVCLFVQWLRLCKRAPLRALVVIAIFLSILTLSTIAIEFITNSNSIEHALGKLMALQEALNSGQKGGSLSISLRLEYLQGGLDLMSDSPLSVIFGHPGGTPMYSGDGLWTAFLVTYGLPLTLYFLAANVVVIWRAVTSRTPDLVFSACVVGAMLTFFVTNRILDYWPAPLVYVLAFSYLTTSGVRPAPVPEGN